MSRVQTTTNGGALRLAKLVEAGYNFHIGTMCLEYEPFGGPLEEIQNTIEWKKWESIWAEARDFVADGDLTRSCNAIIKKMTLCALELNEILEIDEDPTLIAATIYHDAWNELADWAATYNLLS